MYIFLAFLSNHNLRSHIHVSSPPFSAFPHSEKVTNLENKKESIFTCPSPMTNAWFTTVVVIWYIDRAKKSNMKHSDQRICSSLEAEKRREGVWLQVEDRAMIHHLQPHHQLPVHHDVPTQLATLNQRDKFWTPCMHKQDKTWYVISLGLLCLGQYFHLQSWWHYRP